MTPRNADELFRADDFPGLRQQSDQTVTQSSPAFDFSGPAAPIRPVPSAGAPPKHAAGPAPVIPGYQVEEILGSGGMGVVYKARHLALKRVVAIKMVLGGGYAGEQERQRFRSEAEAVARFHHPNIVQIHEVGEYGGLPFAALEFVEGGTFAQRLKRGPVTPREAAEVIATVAEAMHLAHSRNIVHRDLKPANILLDAHGSPKVTDFGVARQLDVDSGVTQAGMVVGTPSYMAPEQASGRAHTAGPAADVYAWRWPIPQPVTGSPDLVRAWVQAVTGREQDAGKSVSALDAAAWRQRRSLVLGSDLRPDLEPTADAVLAWHDARGAASEVAGAGATSYWHLDRLIAGRPEDWSPHARLAAVFHRGGRDAEAVRQLDLAAALGGRASARGWCGMRAADLERVHRHAEAVWLREWVVAADPTDPQAHDDLGHVEARLGRFAEAAEHFTRAAALAPDRVDYRRDVAMARLALGDREGFRKECGRLVELARSADNREAAHVAALTCVLDGNAVAQWDAVVALAARAADGYAGDSRLHTAAQFRAGRFDDALKHHWDAGTPYTHIVWEWFIQGMLRLKVGRHDEARPIIEQKLKMVEFMDRETPRDPASKVWSDWMYYVQCHVLRDEAESLLRAAGLAGATDRPR